MVLKRIATIFGAFGASLLLMGSLAGVANAAAPSTVYVSKSGCSDLGTGTNRTPYCTIQKGVDSVAAGGNVNIAGGKYVEQVVIGSGRNNITLSGAGNSTSIKAPAVMTSTKAIVQISTATGVTLRNLEVSGPGNGGCDSLEYGIRIDNNGQANITNDHVTDIRDNPFSGCQNGVGIQVGRSADNTIGQATITNTKVDNYQKNGITVSGDGSTATIRNNTVVGAGSTNVIAQNGIQISGNATATITANEVKNNSYSPQTVSSTAVLILGAKNNVRVAQNTINNNDVGVYVSETNNATVTQNVIKNSVFNGIFADTGAKNNTFTQNTARGTNGSNDPQYPSYDVEDDSTGAGTLSTANTWHQNDCKTDLPNLLCKQ